MNIMQNVFIAFIRIKTYFKAFLGIVNRNGACIDTTVIIGAVDGLRAVIH